MNEFMSHMIQVEAGRSFVTVALAALAIGLIALEVVIQKSPLPFIKRYRSRILFMYWAMALGCYLSFAAYVLLVWEP